LQIVEFMEKLIQPPTTVEVKSKINSTESFTGFVKNIPDRYRLVSTTGDFTPILPDIIFDKRNMILWSGDLKEALPSMQLLPIEQELINETTIESCETFAIESSPSITKDTNISMPIITTNDDPLSSIINLRYIYSRNDFMDGANEIKINLEDRINEYKKLRIWTGDIKEFIPTVRIDEAVASFSGCHSHFDLPSHLIETLSNIVALSGETTKQTTVDTEHSIREYSNTKLNEIETTPYQAVQTLHEYTMPENWFEYQTIVSWDTNNYMKPMSEKQHHEIEKHIRVPDRNLLFTPETTIDFSLKMKIQEYKNRILWQGDVKEGLPSPVIFQRTDNVTVDILTETLLPETLFDVSYNIEEYIHEQVPTVVSKPFAIFENLIEIKEDLPSIKIPKKTGFVTLDLFSEIDLQSPLFDVDHNIEEHIHEQIPTVAGSSSSIAMNFIVIPNRNHLISFGGSMDGYQKEIIEYMKNMKIWGGDIKEGLPSPKISGVSITPTKILERKAPNISAKILPLEFEHTQEETIRVIEFKEDYIEMSSVVTTDINKQTVEGHDAKAVSVMEKSELEAYTNLLFDYDHKIRINETKRIEDIRIQKKARLVEVQHIRTYERKDTSKIDEFLSTQWIEPFADMVVDDFLDDVIFDSDSHIQDDLKLKYTFSEIFVANTTIGEMLNSNNYIDSSGTVLGSSPMNAADFEKLLNSANTYIKFDSSLSSNDVLETIRTPYVPIIV